VASVSDPIHPLMTILHRCQQIESAMARLYHDLAALHGHDPEIARLWEKTAKEEENHQLQFQLALSLGKDAIIDARVPIVRAEQALRSIRAYHDELRRQRPQVEDALRRMIAMEDELVDLHVSSVAVFTEDRHRKLFAAMMAADKGHVAALQAALSRVQARRD